MTTLQELLETGEPILLDGAMGTMLMALGLEQGNPPEEWNILYPERVQSVHEGYIEAGARVILTNSFGGTSFRLKLHNLQDRVHELNRAAAENARAAADRSPYPVVVAGSMGPTGELLEPLGTMTVAAARAAFAEQAAGLAAGGVDLLWVETMSDLDELRAAVAGAREATDLPVAASMTFDTNRHTMMGVSPEQAVSALRELDLIAIGANCGNGPEEIEDVIAKMTASVPGTPLIAKANAGIPRLIGQELVYDGTPPVMANYAQHVRQLGAQLIGGCCGSTPDHIRAMAAALKESGPVVIESSHAEEAAPTSGADKAEGRRGRRRRHRRDR